MTAIYLRLSNDDGPDKESNSIGNQRDILMRYATENELSQIAEYIDDGYSGILFARPAFQQMMTDIEEGKVNMVLVKDLSRFGRNNTLVAYYLNILFPEFGVKFVAVNDNINSETDGLVINIKSIINEMYVKEVSRKIRQTNKQKVERGEYLGSAPYGYKKVKGKLVVDPVTSPNIPSIFRQALEIAPLSRIGRMYGLSGEQIKNILKNPAYIGNTVSYRSSTISLKVKTKVPQTHWVTKYNTHPVLINEDVFNVIQAMYGDKKKKEVVINEGVFDAILECEICGYKLSRIATGKYECKICGLKVSEKDILAELNKPADIELLTKEDKDLKAQIKKLILKDGSDALLKEKQNRRTEIEYLINNTREEAIDKILIGKHRIEVKYKRGG
ncbi:hypothetical protein AGMMS49992_23790 [Clostridia bacterium]|nr:hypothetical protein AGMMS49992_23790 [Clostridia bacterium]